MTYSVICGCLGIQRASVCKSRVSLFIVRSNSEILGWQFDFYEQWQQWSGFTQQLHHPTIKFFVSFICFICWLVDNQNSASFMIPTVPQTKSLRSPISSQSWCRTCSCWPPPPSSCSVSPAPGTRAGWFLPARTWSWWKILFQTIFQCKKYFCYDQYPPEV